MRRAPEVIDAWFDSGLDALRAVALPVRARGRVPDPLPGRLHLRRGGPDPGLVLLPAGDRDDRLRQARLPQRDRERAGAGRRGPEDVQEQGKRGGPLGHDAESSAPTPCGSICWRRARSGCPSASIRAPFPKSPASSSIPSRTPTASSRATPEIGGPGDSGGEVDRWRTGGSGAGSRPPWTRSPAAWDGYDVTTGLRALMDFVVDDLSNWYVRLNRARFWAPDKDADPAAVATLHEALVTVSRAPGARRPVRQRLAAPCAGGGTRCTWRGFRRRHADGIRPWRRRWTRCDGWPRWRAAGREVVKLRVRQPLARMQVAVPAAVRGPAFRPLLELLRQEVNVKQVEVVASDAELVRLRAKANFRSLGKRFGKRNAGRGGCRVASLTPNSCGPWRRGGRPAWRWTARDDHLSFRGCGRRAGGGQRLAGRRATAPSWRRSTRTSPTS